MLTEKYETGSDGFVWQNAQADDVFGKIQLHVYASFAMQVGNEWQGNKFTNHYNRLYFVRSGSAVLHFKNHSMQMRANHLYLIPAYQLLSHECDEHLDFSWTHFQARIDAGIDFFMLNASASEVDCSSLPYIEQDFARMTQNNHLQNPSAVFERTRLLMGLLQPFIEQLDKQSNNPKANRHKGLLSSINFINDNVTNNISIQELAKKANISAEHFSRKFKTIFNVSPKRYITLRRLGLAKQHLLMSNDSVEQVALKCGFCDIFHFSRAFKQEVGMTPTEFKRGYNVDGLS
jgi:AraC-like DNA-binding protein